MKKQLFCLSLALIFCNVGSLHSQKYLPLPDSNAYWYVDVAVEISVSNFEYVLKVPASHYDTIINSKKYNKVFKNSLEYYDPYVELVGFYRSDTSGKAYFIWADSSNEHILYDVSIKPGDTIFDVACVETYFGHRYYNAIVQDTQHVVIANKSLKQVGFMFINTLYPSQYQWWIEGIGNIGGLINPFPLGMNSSNVECMGAYDTAWYPNFSLIPCNMQGYDVSEREKMYHVTISPNPASDNLIIETGNSDNSRYKVEIYDLCGKLIDQQILQSASNKIDISKLAKGVYFIKLTSGNGSEVKRFLKE